MVMMMMIRRWDTRELNADCIGPSQIMLHPANGYQKKLDINRYTQHLDFLNDIYCGGEIVSKKDMVQILDILKEEELKESKDMQCDEEGIIKMTKDSWNHFKNHVMKIASEYRQSIGTVNSEIFKIHPSILNSTLKAIRFIYGVTGYGATLLNDGFPQEPSEVNEQNVKLDKVETSMKILEEIIKNTNVQKAKSPESATEEILNKLKQNTLNSTNYKGDIHNNFALNESEWPLLALDDMKLGIVPSKRIAEHIGNINSEILMEFENLGIPIDLSVNTNEKLMQTMIPDQYKKYLQPHQELSVSKKKEKEPGAQQHSTKQEGKGMDVPRTSNYYKNHNVNEIQSALQKLIEQERSEISSMNIRFYSEIDARFKVRERAKFSKLSDEEKSIRMNYNFDNFHEKNTPLQQLIDKDDSKSNSYVSTISIDLGKEDERKAKPSNTERKQKGFLLNIPTHRYSHPFIENVLTQEMNVEDLRSHVKKQGIIQQKYKKKRKLLYEKYKREQNLPKLEQTLGQAEHFLTKEQSLFYRKTFEMKMHQRLELASKKIGRYQKATIAPRVLYHMMSQGGGGQNLSSIESSFSRLPNLSLNEWYQYMNLTSEISKLHPTIGPHRPVFPETAWSDITEIDDNKKHDIPKLNMEKEKMLHSKERNQSTSKIIEYVKRRPRNHLMLQLIYFQLQLTRSHLVRYTRENVDPSPVEQYIRKSFWRGVWMIPESLQNFLIQKPPPPPKKEAPPPPPPPPKPVEPPPALIPPPEQPLAIAPIVTPAAISPPAPPPPPAIPPLPPVEIPRIPQAPVPIAIPPPPPAPPMIIPEPPRVIPQRERLVLPQQIYERDLFRALESRLFS